MDVARLISRFSTSASYTVTRRKSARIVRGRAVEQNSSTFAIVASVQPASGKDLLRLPEGRRTNETRMIYTSTLLMPAGQGDKNEADYVSIDGEPWEVQHAEVWLQHNGVAFYRCIAQAVT